MVKETAQIPVYGCPYCDKTVRGPPNNPKLGEKNLETHISSNHPDKLEEFQKTPINQYLVKEEPVEQKEEQAPEFQPLIKAPTPERVVIPFQEIPEAEQWIENFLKTQASVKDKFILFQKQRVKLTGRLPDPMDLEADLKSMDSGVKNDREADYVKFFYESALEDYLRLLEVDRDYGKRGIRMERERPQQMDYPPMSRGISIRRTHEEYPVDYPLRRGDLPSSWMEAELMRLRDEQRRRDEEDRRRQERESAELKAQVIQLQQQLATGGGGNPRLEQKIEQMDADRRRMEAEYAKLKEDTLLERIRQIETLARSGPSSEDIKNWLKDTVDQYRSQLLVEKNLEDMIEKKFALHAGPTQTAVEMEKARNELALGVRKLDVEEKKAAQWGETLKDVARVAGEGIGRGMSGKGQGPEQQQPVQQTCPHCGIPLILPPNVRYGMCPSPTCKGKIEIDENGVPQKYIEQPQQRRAAPPSNPSAPATPLNPEEEPDKGGIN